MSSEAPICEEEPLTQDFVDFAIENAKKIYEKVKPEGHTEEVLDFLSHA